MTLILNYEHGIMRLQSGKASGSITSIQKEEILNWRPYFALKSADLGFSLFADTLSASFLNPFMRVSYLEDFFPTLGSQWSLWGPQKSKNKLTADLWIKLFQKKLCGYRIADCVKRQSSDFLLGCVKGFKFNNNITKQALNVLRNCHNSIKKWFMKMIMTW